EHHSTPRRQPLNRETQVFGRVTTPAFPKRSPFAGTMDQVRPSSGMSTHRRCDHAFVDWPTYPHESHQATALRRSRTEARPRRVDNAKRDSLIEARYRSPDYSHRK